MNLADLKKPFAPDRISWRLGATNADKTKGMALGYIDARDVMERLDEVCGLDWQCEYVSMQNGTCCCKIGIKVNDEWIWRSNGAINLSDSDKADAKEMAEKGSYSDSFKRAAVLFGIGRYLYDLDSQWVAIEPAGRSFKIASGEYKRLEALLSKGASQPAREPVASEAYAPAHIQAPTSKTTSDIVLPEDPDGQVKAWCDREIAKWSDLTRLPDMIMWSDEREAEINRLLRKSPTMHRYLMDKYEAKKDEILKVSK